MGQEAHGDDTLIHGCAGDFTFSQFFTKIEDEADVVFESFPELHQLRGVFRVFGNKANVLHDNPVDGYEGEDHQPEGRNALIDGDVFSIGGEQFFAEFQNNGGGAIEFLLEGEGAGIIDI